MAKIEKILFYVFLFLIPFQIRVFLFNGNNEWNSIFLYLTDILFVGVMVLWIKRMICKKETIRGSTSDRRLNLLILIFLLIIGLSLFFASNLMVGIFQLIKLLEFILLFLYVRNNIKFLKLKNIFLILIASGVLQSILAIAQFLKQASLGLRFVEAGVFTPGEPGVATFISSGEKIMRAYASFPHPNVLAGFLLLCIFCLYSLFLQKESKGIQGVIKGMGLFILIFGLFLTFSRTAIFVFIIISLVMFLYYIIKNRGRFPTKLFVIFLVSAIISTAILFPYLKARFFEISFEEQAIDLRFFYNKMAFAMIKEKPILGIGIGNFVWHSQNYPAFLRAGSKMLGLETIPQWFYQPVHNIYLLIAVEMGIIGLAVFLLFIGSILLKGIQREFKGNSKGILFLVISFLILGLFDHYFWSLHSGGIIFWLSLGLLKS